MDDTTETQEVSTGLAIPTLTADDLDRINNCEFYQKTKEIMQSAIDYKGFEVGTAIHIYRKYDNSAITRSYQDKTPEKYLIIKNEDGFIFVKRINANGKPGQQVTCVTIDYPSARYEVRSDDAYLDALLLDTQSDYDPAASAKALAKKKNKASRENGKIRTVFEDNTSAYAFIKTLSVGDSLWKTSFSYGGDLTQYSVKEVKIRPAKPPTGNGIWGSNRNDEDYTVNGFKDVIEVELSVVHSTYKWANSRTISFKDLSKQFWASHSFFYTTKPVTPDDLA